MKLRKPLACLMPALLFMVSLAFLGDGNAHGQRVSMPQIKFQDRTLPNGMRVLSAVDRSSPTVAIQVWYHVG